MRGLRGKSPIYYLFYSLFFVIFVVYIIVNDGGDGRVVIVLLFQNVKKQSYSFLSCPMVEKMGDSLKDKV